MKESEGMRILFITDDLSRTFGQLSRAASQHPKRSGQGLFEAAVAFTIQLAIDAASCDPDKSRGLERALTAKLATWIDEAGKPALHLWTHDITCVIGNLDRAARRYGQPSPIAFEMQLKALAVAAVAFTIQVAIEETASDAPEMRALERALIAKLEAPFEPTAFPISVDAQFGKTWEQLKDEA